MYTSIVGHTAKIQHVQEILQAQWSAVEKPLTFTYIFIHLCLLNKKSEPLYSLIYFPNYNTTDHKPQV